MYKKKIENNKITTKTTPKGKTSMRNINREKVLGSDRDTNRETYQPRTANKGSLSKELNYK